MVEETDNTPESAEGQTKRRRTFMPRRASTGLGSVPVVTPDEISDLVDAPEPEARDQQEAERQAPASDSAEAEVGRLEPETASAAPEQPLAQDQSRAEPARPPGPTTAIFFQAPPVLAPAGPERARLPPAERLPPLSGGPPA